MVSAALSGIRVKSRAMNEILGFRSAAEFRRWLEANHHTCDGIWLRIYKKDSGIETVTYAEAVDEALCFGWIDGLKQKHDEGSWRQRFTPRRAKSGWSKINTGHAERLIAAGKMAAPGQAEIDAAKRDGRWKAAYDSQRKATFPQEFLRAVQKNKNMQAFFDSLSSSNRYAIAYRLQTAKRPETKEKRMKMILEMLRKGEKFH